MIQVLTALMEEGQYDKCLKAAEQQLLKGGWNISQLAQINLVICRCRLGLQDPQGAVPSGLLAVKLLRDLGEWDLLGRALLNVGTAFVGVRKYNEALEQFYGYFEYLPYYRESKRFEGAIWKHIGITHQRRLETPPAVEALNRAREWFTKHGVDHGAFTCTHDLLNTHLQVHETDPTASLAPVVELLAEERAMVKKYPGDTHMRGLLYLDEASYYFQVRRFGRALVRAMQAMEVHRGDPMLNFHSHMVLYRCNRELGHARDALGYALAARVEALHARAYDLEFLASQAMAEVIREQGVEVVRQLDVQYKEMGIDLGQYLSPSLLRRDN